ncbi:hypothetical protein AXG93_3575s1040 [Marchantia polymorpha subsp. ruderalis]|uniref:Uncharacterized protein n=1 Tax=Marchantia polymorpha subsp. ruderalis TaxID=1480154 RepID=A0A176WCZ0_MARPO|nr:hypothetical protein AXG93_3575s1040 [Marchantia polymorpha subsp. ruderalis]
MCAPMVQEWHDNRAPNAKLSRSDFRFAKPANEDETLDSNEIDTEEDDTKLVLLSARVDKSEDELRLEVRAEPVPASSTQVTSGTVDLDNDEDPLADKPKSVGLSAADMLSEQVIPLLRYLDGKLEKYAESSIARSYVELVRSRTRTKVAASA